MKGLNPNIFFFKDPSPLAKKQCKTNFSSQYERSFKNIQHILLSGQLDNTYSSFQSQFEWKYFSNWSIFSNFLLPTSVALPFFGLSVNWVKTLVCFSVILLLKLLGFLKCIYLCGNISNTCLILHTSLFVITVRSGSLDAYKVGRYPGRVLRTCKPRNFILSPLSWYCFSIKHISSCSHYRKINADSKSR